MEEENPFEFLSQPVVCSCRIFDEAIALEIELRNLGLKPYVHSNEQENGEKEFYISVPEPELEFAKDYLQKRDSLGLPEYDGSPKCKFCGSGEVSEVESCFWGGFGAILVFPIVYNLIVERTKGRLYFCSSCRRNYRYKL